MKVMVLGAGGKLGLRLVESGLAKNHDVTAAARNPELFSRAWAGRSQAMVRVIQVDVTNPAQLEAAMAGHDAIVSAAGNVADGQRFVDLFDRVTTSAERVFGGDRRVWMLAGAGLLDIPNAGRIGIGLPFVPALYRPHLENWRRLERSQLDWALMCPGPLVPADGPRLPAALSVSTDALPFDVGAWARFAPPVALSLMMKAKLPQITVSYEDVAEIIIGSLTPRDRFSRKRVGVGLVRADQNRG